MSHPFVIRNSLVDDTLCTALEGGINYWAIKAEPNRKLAPDAQSKMFPDESPFTSEVLTMGYDVIITLDPDVVDNDELRPRHKLTLEMMKRGIRMYCAANHTTPLALEDDPLDASGADNVVQYALFGKLIFG